MGIIDKLRDVVTWQSAVVIMFYLGAVLSLTIVAIFYNIVWLIAAGATTLGIVAGSLTGFLRQPFTTNSQLKVDTIQRLGKIESNIAEIATQFANLKSQFEIMKISKEIEEL